MNQQEMIMQNAKYGDSSSSDDGTMTQHTYNSRKSHKHVKSGFGPSVDVDFLAA